MHSPTLVDLVWVLTSAALVFMMQAGFCCLESGYVRSKNSVNVAAKNFADFCISAGIF
jgi:ammonium transporter, Amt family